MSERDDEDRGKGKASTDDSASSSTVLRITRRQFLATGTGVIASKTLMAAEERPYFLATPGVGVTLHYGERTWPVLIGMFCRSQRPSIRRLNDLSMSLSGARYPGSDLSPDFDAKVYPQGGQWFIRVKFDIDGVYRDMELAKWMDSSIDDPESGVSFPARVQRFSIGSGQLDTGKSRRTIRFRADFSGVITMKGSAPARLSVVSTLRSLELQARSVAYRLDRAEAQLRTRFEFGECHGAGPFRLGLIRPSMEVSLVHGKCTATALSRTDGRVADADFEWNVGQSTFVVRKAAGGRSGVRIQLEATKIRFTGSQLERCVRIEAIIARRTHGVELNSFSFEIQGGSDYSLRQTFSNRALDSLELKANLVGLHVPMEANAVAALSMRESQACTLRFCGKFSRLAHPEPASYADTRIWIGRKHAAICLPMDHTDLRVKRALDLFDLRFGFVGYSMVSQRGDTHIQKRPEPSLKAHERSSSRIIVQFPPQHVFEEAFKPPERAQCTELVMPETAKKGPCQPCTDVRQPISQSDLARTRVADPSRLVFVDSSPASDQPGRLSISLLTDWRELGMVVHRRVHERNLTLKQQMDLVEIGQDMDVEAAKQKVLELCTPPSPLETSIEAIFRMQLSPDSGAKWLTPSRPVIAAQPNEVWAARLASPEQVAMRAVYARDMDLSFLDPNKPPSGSCDFTGSMGQDERSQIVAMTSFFGIAALRRLVDSGGLFTDSGMVFLPDKPYTYLDTGTNAPEMGVMLAKPFEKFELTLSRGATVDARWSGEPPANYSDSNGNSVFLSRAFSIQKYSHRIQDGRDVFVEILHKGFMFPLGHRTTYIKITQREFHPEKLRPDGAPVAYLVQHLHLLCQKPVKLYPAYNQPFDSRDFPPARVELLTVMTPDLSEPSQWGLAQEANVCMPLTETCSETSSAHVFWPKLLHSDNADVLFEYLVDGNPHPVVSPLLFVDNAAAHDPCTMKSVVDAYNRLAGDDAQLRTAMHFGVSRRYAIEQREGDCSLNTIRWTLSARGGVGDADVADHSDVSALEAMARDFRMDAYMEGQDQPPFYPAVASAIVHAQSIDRLTGRRNTAMTVSFNERYVRSGFSASINPGEIYLNVQESNIFLDASARGDSTGSVARPNALLKAFSRSLGPIGGRATESRSESSMSLVAGRTNESVISVGSALDGRFDPMEYFGSALSEAKLLGIIPLKDILRVVAITAAPKLVEQVDYFADKAPGAIASTLKEGLASALDASTDNPGLLKRFENQVIVALDGLDPMDLYPSLWRAYLDTKAQMSTMRATLDGLGPEPEPGALVTLVNQLIASIRRLLAAMAEVARDPMPAFLSDAIKQVVEYWKVIEAIVRNPGEWVRILVNRYVEDSQNAVMRILCQEICRNGTFDLVFGRGDFGALPDDIVFYPNLQSPPSEDDLRARQCRALLRFPEDFLPRLSTALFSEHLGAPIAKAVSALRNLSNLVCDKKDQVVGWSRKTLADQIVQIILAGDQNCRTSVLASGVDAIVSQIDQALERLGGDPSPSDVQNALLEAEAGLREQFTALSSELLEESDRIKIVDVRPDLLESDPEEYFRLTAKRSFDQARKHSILAVSNALRNQNSVASLIEQIHTSVGKLLRQAIGSMVEDVNQLASAKAADVIERLFQVAEALVDQALASVHVYATKKFADTASGWCRAGTHDLALFLDKLVFFAVGRVGVVRERMMSLNSRLSVLAMKCLDVEASTPELELGRHRLAEALSLAASTSQRIALALDHFERARRACATANQLDICANIQTSMKLYARAVDLRREAYYAISATISALRTAEHCAKGLGQSFSALEALFKELAPEVLRPLLEETLGLDQLLVELETDERIKALGENVETANAAIGQAIAAARALRSELDNVPVAETTLESLFRLEPLVKEYVESALRRSVATVLHAVLPFEEDFLAGVTNPAIEECANVLLAIDSKARLVVEKLLLFLNQNTVAALAVRSILSQRIQEELENAREELTAEVAALEAVMGNADPILRAAAIGGIISKWRGQTGPAPAIRAVRVLERLFVSIVSGQLQSVVDFGRIKHELEQIVADFVPSRINLAYDFDAALPDFPASGPIFMIDGKEEIDWEMKNDLVLETRIEIDLFKGERKVTSSGRMRSFSIHLLGSSLDLATISFKNAHFIAKPGQHPDFKIEFAGFKTGSALKFISALQGLVGGGNKSDGKDGYYYQYSLAPPEIEVGYRFNKPYLQLGSMTLQNIGFAVSAHLPIDSRQAEFRFSFASAEKPFLISQAPYGGGGFVGLRANARGIIGFEIQFEFGAVVAIQFGVLSGHGRVTAGIYLLSYRNGARRLEGFVHALGEGHIACFGAAFSLEVRTIQTENGDMEGSSTYSFSFSIGMFDVSYSVTATYKTQGSKNSGSVGGGGGGGERDFLVPRLGEGRRRNPSAVSNPVVRNFTPSKKTQWRKYAGYFDI